MSNVPLSDSAPSQSTTEPPVDSSTHKSTLSHDFQASLVVFLVAMPLCLGIALASGAPVASGLVTGIIGGVIVGLLAGSPLQVSGPAAGLTVICAEVIRQHGMSGLGVIVFFAGLIQLAAGVAKLGKWFRAVSPAVIHGMLSGIGVLILASQFHVLVDQSPKGNGVQNLAGIPSSLKSGLSIPTWESTEIRVARRDILKSVTKLVSRQNELKTEVSRHLAPQTSEAPSPETPRTPFDWPALADRQSSILADLQAEIGRITEKLSKESITQLGFEAPLQSATQALETAQQRLKSSDVDELLASQDAAKSQLSEIVSSQKQHPWALFIGVLTVAIIVCWSKFAKGPLKAIPGALMGIVCAGLLAAVLQLPILQVNIPDNLTSDLSWLSLDSLTRLPIKEILIGALVMASVASAETLLCATAVDKMHTGPRTQYDRELMAQGVGNTLCGIVGVLPMTGVIVRSASNVQAGGKTRLSAILHGVWLVVFILLLSDLVRAIPVSALAGILVYTGFRLLDINGFKKLWQIHRPGAYIFLITVIVIVAFDLLSGVITGIVLSALKLLLRFSHFEVLLTQAENRYDLKLNGAATFLKLPLLTTELAKIPNRKEVHVSLDNLSLVDHACLELLIDWGHQYETAGGRFHMDWETLHSRFGSKSQVSHKPTT